MKENSRKSLVSGVALTCGAILLGSMNAPVVHADTPAAVVNGSTTPKTTTEVVKSASPAATQQAANDKGTSDKKTNAETAPAASDKAKLDNTASNKSKTEDKTKTPADSKKDPTTVEAIAGVGQETVVGEDPYLNTDCLSPDQWQKLGLMKSDLQNAKLVWTKKPDVSKVGTHYETAKLTYTETPGPGDPTQPMSKPVTKTLTVKIKVEVKAGQKKGSQEVRNRLTYIDADSNEIVASYSWVGKQAASQNETPVDAQIDQNQEPEQVFSDDFANDVDQTVIGLGYQVLQDDHDAIDSLRAFGTADQVVNVFVKKDAADHKLMTWGQAAQEWDQAEQKPFELPAFLDSSYNNVDVDDPTNLIANVADLPAGAKVSWGIAPHYDEDGLVDNDPTIVVSVPGQKDIVLHLSAYDGSGSKEDQANGAAKDSHEASSASIDKLLLRKHAYNYVPTWGPAVVTKGQALNPADVLADKEGLAQASLASNQNSEPESSPSVFMILARESARSRHVPTQQELTDYISDPRRWSWDIAPDLSKPGYTIAFARFTPLAGDDPALVDLT